MTPEQTVRAYLDAMERRDLAAKLKVASAPSLVLVKDRKVAARIEGRASAPQIEALLAEHLDADPVAV